MMRNRFYLFSAVIILILAVLVMLTILQGLNGFTPILAQQDNYKYYPYIYEPNGKGIYIEYPTDWKQLSSNRISHHDIVVFQAPTYVDPTGLTNFRVSTDNSNFNKEPLTPQAYLHKLVNSLQHNNNTADFAVIANRTDIISAQGFPGYVVSYLQLIKSHDTVIRGIETGYILNNTVYSMTFRTLAQNVTGFGTESNIYMKVIPQIRHMINSFIFISDPTAELGATVDAVMATRPTPVPPTFFSYVLDSFGVSNSEQTSLTPLDNGFTLYKNNIYGITIQYPSNWIKHESYQDDIVQFNPVDKKAFLMILLARLPENITLVPFTDRNIVTLTGDNPSLVTNKNKTILNGIPAYKVEVNGGIDIEGIVKKFYPTSPHFERPLYSVKTMGIFMVHNGIGYGIVYSSDPAADELKGYYYYLPLIQNMINSFKITGAPKGIE
jgi:hypothetical protein